jgi:hypothetical protein
MLEQLIDDLIGEIVKYLANSDLLGLRLVAKVGLKWFQLAKKSAIFDFKLRQYVSLHGLVCGSRIRLYAYGASYRQIETLRALCFLSRPNSAKCRITYADFAHSGANWGCLDLFRNIEILDLSFCCDIFLANIEQLSNVRCLMLRDIFGIKDHVLEALYRHGGPPELYIDLCSYITDAGLAHRRRFHLRV